MTRWVALLRAVNVGGTGKIAMAHLRAAAEAEGLEAARTVLRSGNLVFSASLGRARLVASAGLRLKEPHFS